ncbi:MAG: PDZ domain-containing protein [Gemmataceae bacterium]
MRRSLSAFLALFVAAPVLAGEKTKAEPVNVPYRLTETQHVLVRVKLNGKGPFNFIVDTGAPVSFIATKVGKAIGLEPGEKKVGVLDTLEFEGGLKQNKVKVMVDTPFQLEGMNGMGLAGLELHGIIGYTQLARYKMEFDFTRDKLRWTPLDFDPPPPVGIKDKGAVGSLEMIGGLMKLLGSLSGLKMPDPPEPRGFLGVWLEEKDKQVVVSSVLKDSPAANARLQKGDILLKVNDRDAGDIATAHRLTSRVLPGDEVRLTLKREGKEIETTVRAGSGL